LDNFPHTKEQWATLFEKGIVIDEVVCLKDPSENSACLMKRWYRVNRGEIDGVVKERVDAAAAVKAKKEEEQRYV
jgi:adenylate/nucleoside-diphosphate kinase